VKTRSSVKIAVLLLWFFNENECSTETEPAKMKQKGDRSEEQLKQKRKKNGWKATNGNARKSWRGGVVLAAARATKRKAFPGPG